MLLDLVSPWAAAVEAEDSVRARAAFRRRNAALLEAVRRQRAPLTERLALASDIDRVHLQARRTGDAGFQQRVRDAVAGAAQNGATAPATIVLLAGTDSGDPMEPLPYPTATVVLFVDRIADETDLVVAIARGLAATTRWHAADSASPLASRSAQPWDRWMLAREIGLSEWVYTEGVGLHLAQALLPDVSPRRLLGISAGGFRRLREQENGLRALLAADLHQPGIDLVLRWLAPDAASALHARPSATVPLPPLAGRYLAWRMTAARIARVGLHGAMRMAAR